MVAEDPFNTILDSSKNIDWKNVKGYLKGEEVSYWAHRDKALIVNTPRYGRKVFTGRSHMPTPTKLVWFVNVNVINNANGSTSWYSTRITT
jgi:nitrate reductase alpha subunit